MRYIYLIIEYGVAEDAINPIDFDPFERYPEFKGRMLTDAEYRGYRNADGSVTEPTAPMAIRSSLHMSQIVGLIKTYKKKDYDIVCIPYQHAISYIKKNKDRILVINASVGGFFNDWEFRQFKDTIYQCMSAGNEGSKGEGIGSQKDYWTGIGAINHITKEHEDFSSWGKGAVDYVGLSGLPITYTYFGKRKGNFSGTSSASPWHGMNVMDMRVDFIEKYGRVNTIDEVLTTIDKYVQDVDQVGKDLKTGKGLYEYKEGELVRQLTWDEERELARQWVIEQGISDGTNPQDPLTREQYWVMKYRESLGK